MIYVHLILAIHCVYLHELVSKYVTHVFDGRGFVVNKVFGF